MDGGAIWLFTPGATWTFADLSLGPQRERRSGAVAPATLDCDPASIARGRTGTFDLKELTNGRVEVVRMRVDGNDVAIEAYDEGAGGFLSSYRYRDGAIENLRGTYSPLTFPTFMLISLIGVVAVALTAAGVLLRAARRGSPHTAGSPPTGR